MSKGKLLIVDDDEDIRQLVGGSLVNRGYEVITAENGEDGLAKAHAEHPDLIILDIEMPGMDGIQTCQEIRRRLNTPIIFLSVRSETTDRVLGLGVGGDNYLTKPFQIPELIAHVDAAMRRQAVYSRPDHDHHLLKVKDLCLDIRAHELKRNGCPIQLTATEFKVFRVLAANPDRAITREQLLDQVWQANTDGVYSRTIDVHIGRIRRKIGDDSERPRYILTVAGVGYKVAAEGNSEL